MESFLRDVRFGIRMLARNPGFTSVAVFTLALGIGANTAVFSVVHALLLQPLPYPEADRLVSVWPETNFNTAMIGRVAAGVPALEGMSGVSQWTLQALDEGSEPLEVEALFVSTNHFDLLGVQPWLGRGFTAENATPGQSGVVVLSYEFWHARYGGDRGILGRAVRLSDNEHDTRVVIGVMPPDYRPVAGTPAAWVPIVEQPGLTLATDHTWWITLRIGRLAPGATHEQVEAQLRQVAPELRSEVPNLIDPNAAQAPSAPTLHEAMVGSTDVALFVVWGAVALVLLIACTNVANLLLARGEARLDELLLRRALGASRGRLMRQRATECLILVLVGALAGVFLGWAFLRLLVTQAPADLPQMRVAAMSGPVLGFTLALSLFAALVLGTLPALRAGAAAAGQSLRRSGAGVVGGRAGRRLSAALVAFEVALAVVLVTSAGLMLRTLANLYNVDPGFRAQGVLVLRPSPPEARYPNLEAAQRFYADVLRRVRTLPNVESAGAIQIRPVTNSHVIFPMYIEGDVVPAGATPPSHSFRAVTPGYFRTMRIPVLRGRDFEDSDRVDTRRVAVVNRAFVQRYWPSADPIDRRIHLFAPSTPPLEVVGVVGNVRQFSLDREPEPEVYVPHTQLPWETSLWIMARARSGDAASLGPSIREAIWSIDEQVPIADMEPLSRVLGRSAATTRFFTLLLGAFGGLALLLAAVGIYGVSAVTVVRRLPEFGVRVALGARGRDVLRTALARGLAPVALGIGLGWAGAFATTGLLRSLLFDVRPSDPGTFASVVILLSAVGLGALLPPAWRAAGVDPLVAMRRE